MNNSEVNFRNVNTVISKLQDMPKNVTKQLLPFVVEITPSDKHPHAKDPGHARANTVYDGDVTITANYDYAQRILHEGWSDQLAAGIFDEAVGKQIESLVKDYIRKI